MSDITSTPLPALGICFEDYEYPYPVRFLPLSNDLQHLAMAYMDIPPARSPTGRRSFSCMARHSAVTTSAMSSRS